MLKQPNTHHKLFGYLEKPPEDLLNAYFQPDNQVRRVVNLYRRVMSNALDSDGYEGDTIPFTVPA